MNINDYPARMLAESAGFIGTPASYLPDINQYM